MIGAVSGAVFAAATGSGLALTVGCMWAACTTSAGRTSPDIDQYPEWTGNRKGVRRWWWVSALEAVLYRINPRHGDPTGHRRIAHSWVIPAAVGAPLAVAGLLVPAPVSVASTGLTGRLVPWAVFVAVVLAQAAVVGWTSHLGGDWIFGKGRRSPMGGRGGGIPWILWWHHRGGWFKSGGWAERIFVWTVVAPVGVLSFARFPGVGSTARACLGG